MRHSQELTLGLVLSSALAVTACSPRDSSEAASDAPGRAPSTSAPLATGPTPDTVKETGQRFMIGNERWVKVTKPIDQQFSNGTERLKVGDTCFMIRGDHITEPSRRTFVYHTVANLGSEDDVTGTGCPEGATLDMTPREATHQDETYTAFDKKRTATTVAVLAMLKNVGSGNDGLKEVKSPNTWVTVVNPLGVEQQYSNGSDILQYGDNCIAEGGTAYALGKLASGERVYTYNNPGTMGTPCPTGTIYIKSLER